MAINILMPALSPTMEKGNLAKWLVKVGDTVKSGDIIAEIETDKATMEVEAVDEGVISQILVEAGAQDVPVNTVIAVVGEGAVEGVKAVVIPSPLGEGKGEVKLIPITTKTVTPEYSGATKLTTMREALRDAMAEEMRRDPDVFIMGEEVAEYQGAYKITQGLLEEFGERRVIDTPITEHGFAGIAVGAAYTGLKPIVEFMTFNFSMQAIDHIINSAAKTLYMSGGQMGCPIVFRGPNGAAARVGAQHSQDYTSWYAHIPGLYVLAPSNAADAKGLLKAAIRDPNPVVFLENEILYGVACEVPEEDVVIPIGKARIAREGSDITFVAWSIGVQYATKAADELAKEGISVEIIDLRSIRPLDTDAIINSVKKTGRCVVVEEGWQQCGMGGEISARIMELAFDYLDAPVLRVSGKDVPMPYAANLEKLALPNVGEVVDAAKAVLYR
jgi:pyruvate dehydrogenase E1 component beta subunit